MENQSSDRRIRRTKAQLKGALTQLLQEKDPEEVTVTELTVLADVSRGTFYCHYRDINDMLDQMQEETIREFTALMDAYSATELRKGLRPILEDVFLFIRRNFDSAASTFGQRRRSDFLEQFKGVLRDKVAREWSGLYHFTDVEEREDCLSFLVGGVVGLVQSWFARGGKESPEEMAALAEALILRGIHPMGSGPL